ncbi:SAICAR synthetase [Hyaloscypha hepaticicola]|uniref:Phosphoribosylaminoimidazole-succinocarboxamide synthase n=1 Tax=Hyaloscypha hepaticicola TaxID=2082293 RepID=A0A2J6PLV3_9HELO|nr:SAICAR synthetase [Hyaloscypha hepaticicola]
MAEAGAIVTETFLEALPKIATGKVRDLYEVDSKTLLFVASDRISAYDGIPSKGRLLTLLSAHWFNLLPTLIPNLRTHFLTLSLPSSVPQFEHAKLQNRSMQVRRLKIFPIEAIVRGYITGSAWKEYQRSGTVHKMPIVAGLKESEAFPQGALYTPSTKAEAGQNDENISIAEAAEIVGPKYAQKIEDLAIKLYTVARDYAAERGIIIADSKFEFGLDEETEEVVLVDEVLTPDSSRFWPADKYEIGREQMSYDKQFLRDWLTSEGLKGNQGVKMPQEIVNKTAEKYREAFEKLTGQKWADAIKV